MEFPYLYFHRSSKWSPLERFLELSLLAITKWFRWTLQRHVRPSVQREPPHGSYRGFQLVSISPDLHTSVWIIFCAVTYEFEFQWCTSQECILCSFNETSGVFFSTNYSRNTEILWWVFDKHVLNLFVTARLPNKWKFCWCYLTKIRKEVTWEVQRIAEIWITNSGIITNNCWWRDLWTIYFKSREFESFSVVNRSKCKFKVFVI